MKRKSRGPKKNRRRISDGAFPQQEASATGNHQQRQAYRAILRKIEKTRRKDIAAELAKLPQKVRDLIKGTRELNRAVERKKTEDDATDRP